MNAAQIALQKIRIERKYFGGIYLRNSHAKEKRPLAVRQPMHLVMRSEHAKDAASLFNHERAIQRLIYRQGRRFGMRIYRLANAGDHLHLLILPRSRRGYRSFVRAISGLVARLVLRAERGRASGVKFWDKRPFTRILRWGRDYATICQSFLEKNLEAIGFQPLRRASRHTPSFAKSDGP